MFQELSETEKQKFEAIAKRDAERFAKEEAECVHARNWTKLLVQRYPPLLLSSSFGSVSLSLPVGKRRCRTVPECEHPSQRLFQRLWPRGRTSPLFLIS
jgi:hypothetical protein